MNLDLTLIQDFIVLALEIMALGLGISLMIMVVRTGSVSELRKKVKALEDEKEELVKKYEEKIRALEEKHKQELEAIGRVNTMLIELKKAIDAGAVRLACPKHPDAKVEVLADGTILCGKKHRLWPKGDEQ